MKIYLYNSFLCLVFALLYGNWSVGQFSSYLFSEATGPYETINPPAGQGGSVSTSSGSNTARATATLTGFSFCFGGVTYTNPTIYQYQNGFISFTSQSLTTANRVYPLTNYNNTICAFGDELITTGTSSIGWRVIGSHPNRVVVFQWGQSVPGNNGSGTPASNNYWRRLNNGHSNDRLHFQIRLYEGTNVIEFHYLILDHPSQTSGGSVSNVQVGLRGGSSSDFNVRTKSAGTPWNANTAPASGLPTTTGTNAMPFNNIRNNANNKPSASTTPTDANSGRGTGTIFRWSPPVGAWNPSNPTVLENCYNPLAVTLSNFLGTAEKRTNKLEWETESEVNNDYFIVEASADGVNWNELGRVNGAGSTIYKNNYDFHHENPEDVQYYRLKQIDYDGTRTDYGPIVIERKAIPAVLIRKTNLLGQDVEENFNGLIILHYSDGTTVKMYQ